MTNRASNKLTTTRKMTVRVALASGATIATLFGAQSLSTRDLAALMPTASAPADIDDMLTPTAQIADATQTLAPTTVLPTIGTTPIAPAAPSLVIIRNAGAVPVTTVASQVTAVPTKNSTSAPIKPPAAIVIEAPPSSGSSTAPQPAPAQPAPRTRSSR